MRQRVHYKIIHAGAFKRSKETMDQAAEFASSLEPGQLITINLTGHGPIVVWYKDK